MAAMFRFAPSRDNVSSVQNPAVDTLWVPRTAAWGPHFVDAAAAKPRFPDVLGGGGGGGGRRDPTEPTKYRPVFSDHTVEYLVAAQTLWRIPYKSRLVTAGYRKTAAVDLCNRGIQIPELPWQTRHILSVTLAAFCAIRLIESIWDALGCRRPSPTHFRTSVTEDLHNRLGPVIRIRPSTNPQTFEFVIKVRRLYRTSRLAAKTSVASVNRWLAADRTRVDATVAAAPGGPATPTTPIEVAAPTVRHNNAKTKKFVIVVFMRIDEPGRGGSAVDWGRNDPDFIRKNIVARAYRWKQ